MEELGEKAPTVSQSLLEGKDPVRRSGEKLRKDCSSHDKYVRDEHALFV
jgi:hypothetical protein